MRQGESSVMVSIEELLKDAHSREMQEREAAARAVREADARRLDALRRRELEEEERLRAQMVERERRAYEAQRKQAELAALREGAVVRARTEAEAQARLAALQVQQEHERSLHALRHDRHKKRLVVVLVTLSALAAAGAVGGGLAIKRSNDAAVVAAERLHAMQDEKEHLEAEQATLRAQIGSAQDPAEVARLQQELADAQAKLRSVATRIDKGPHAAAPPAPLVPPRSTAQPSGGSKGTPSCAKGDPLCATVL
jgi:hypothetical protein